MVARILPSEAAADDAVYMARSVLLDSVQDSAIGTLVQPGPNYVGMWARDGMLQIRALLNLGHNDLARDLLRLYARYQLTESTDPSTVLIRRKGRADWHEGLASYATPEYVRQYAGAFPTNVYDGQGYNCFGEPFRPGVGEIYGEVPDIDSTAWWVIEAADYCERTHDLRTAREFLFRSRMAMSFLLSKDTDGDGLLEQGPNEDWADCLKRSGKITYTQGVWYKALIAAASLEELVGSRQRAEELLIQAADVYSQTNTLLFKDGRYVECIRPDGTVSERVSQDTAWLVVFGMAPEGYEEELLSSFDELRCEQGHGIVYPLYDPEQTGPTRMEHGEYHNGGVWTWLSSVEAWARWELGDYETGDMLMENALRHSTDTVYEWVHGVTGEAHNPGFATGAAALLCAILEGRHARPSAARALQVSPSLPEVGEPRLRIVASR